MTVVVAQAAENRTLHGDLSFRKTRTPGCRRASWIVIVSADSPTIREEGIAQKTQGSMRQSSITIEDRHNYKR